MNLKKKMLRYEKTYSKYATKNKKAIRIKNERTNDIRPDFFHDIDRIIHCYSYTRYIDKTQVFSNQENDNISKRIIHVQLVSKIARTIGRGLGLNEDLIEAIALGHDIGHTPYGHFGESLLNELSLKYDNTYFMHNVQSVRTLMVLEDFGYGKNLTIQTLDGILCHNGEFVQDKYQPIKKNISDFLYDYNKCYTDPEYAKKLVPMTLEGCVVRISDIIGYLGRDIEDAVELGLFDKRKIPNNIKKVLGTKNKDIINNIILDILNNSVGKNYIKMSDEIYNAVKELKEFNYEHIYSIAMDEKTKKKIKKQFTSLFEYNLKIIKNKQYNSNIYKVFLNNMNEEYHKSTSDARKVIDYIAGMTDDYFEREVKKVS